MGTVVRSQTDLSVYHGLMTTPAASAAQAARVPAGPAREKILATAFRLFYAQGLRAAGIDTIIAESGISKATFYKYFPAKDELILAYLDRSMPSGRDSSMLPRR
ncbi:uncharacterized HTH-type transcriptional regulator YxaF, partial [Arthrobacter sp. Hiyo6]